MRLSSPHIAGLLADSVNDADSTRKVYLLAGGLAALGIGLILITVWFWRNSRNDPALLGPLEAMGTRGFRKLDRRSQQELLDSARPPDAEPLHVVAARQAVDPEAAIDLKNIDKSARSDYDDWREEQAEAVPPAVDDGLAPAGAALDDAAADVVEVPVDESIAAGAVATATAVAVAVDEPIEQAAADSPEPVGSDESVEAIAASESVTDVDSETETETEPEPESDPRSEAETVITDQTAETGLEPEPLSDGPIPLLIVPIDHDLAPVVPSEPSVAPAAAERNGSTPADTLIDAPSEDVPVTSEPPARVSIDPLLRKFQRSDG